MLIQALCEYANKQLERAAPEGWCEQPIHYRIVLTPEGEIADIVDVRIEVTETLKTGKEKKRLVPEKIILPERWQSSGIHANIIDHRPLYIFGLNYENDKFDPNDRTEKARKSQEACLKRNLAFFKDIHSPVCDAFRNFVYKWEPQNNTEHPALLKLGKDYKNAYFGFCLQGGGNLEEDSLFKAAYNAYFEKESSKETGEKGMCSVYGERLEIARIHDKIKFPGGLSSGSVFIGFNANAFESYGKTQSYNANISEKAMKEYTAAMNALLSDKRHYKVIDDLVIMYFAMKSDDSKECDAFSNLLEGSLSDTKKSEEVEKTDTELDGLMAQATGGGITDVITEGIDENVDFYVVGMTPNSSRISVKFFWEGRFGTIAENLKKYQEDLQIGYKRKNIYFSQIRRELVSPKSNVEKVSPSLMSSLTMAALQGTPFPMSMLSTVIKRIKIDADGENDHYTKLNNVRAGIIKACLNRNFRKEKIGMTWDDNNLNPAYVCGGLFSIYEEIQKKAAATKLNRTIKDSYFSSACSCPNVIMPKLEKLSMHHLRKLNDDPFGGYFMRMKAELITKLNGKFPATLSLDEQGQFIIGYWQMNNYLYLSKEEKEKVKANNTETAE